MANENKGSNTCCSRRILSLRKAKKTIFAVATFKFLLVIMLRATYLYFLNCKNHAFMIQDYSQRGAHSMDLSA